MHQNFSLLHETHFNIHCKHEWIAMVIDLEAYLFSSSPSRLQRKTAWAPSNFEKHDLNNAQPSDIEGIVKVMQSLSTSISN